MSEPIEREYRYRISLSLLYTATPFLGLMSALAIYFAFTNSDPVYLQGVLEFPAVLANIAAGAAGILFAILFVGSLVFVVEAFTHRQRIALTATELLVPKGFWSSAEQSIPYRDIIELTTRSEPDGTQTLMVRHPQGKYPISESLLPSKSDFQELCQTLAERVAGRAPGPGGL